MPSDPNDQTVSTEEWRALNRAIAERDAMPSDPLPLSPSGKVLAANWPHLGALAVAIEQEARTLARAEGIAELRKPTNPPTICRCGSAKSCHRDADKRDHEYEPRYEPMAWRDGYAAALSRLGERE